MKDFFRYKKYDLIMRFNLDGSTSASAYYKFLRHMKITKNTNIKYFN